MCNKTHKDLQVWQDSMSLAKKVYRLIQDFPEDERFGLSLQMKRSAISIPSNIAEGAARSSKREFEHFLYISLGSLSELETQWLLAFELGMTKEKPETHVTPVRKMLLGLIRHIKKN